MRLYMRVDARSRANTARTFPKPDPIRSPGGPVRSQNVKIPAGSTNGKVREMSALHTKWNQLTSKLNPVYLKFTGAGIGVALCLVAISVTAEPKPADPPAAVMAAYQQDEHPEFPDGTGRRTLTMLILPLRRQPSWPRISRMSILSFPLVRDAM